MLISVSERSGCRIIHLLKNIDSMCSAEFSAKLAEVMPHSGMHLILDFSQVNFIDSAAISTLAKHYRDVQDHGGKIVFAGCNATVTRVFHIIGFHRFFPMVATIDDAIASLA